MRNSGQLWQSTRIFSRTQWCGHDREAEPDEEAGPVRERAQRVEAVEPGAAQQLVDELLAQALVAGVAVHDQRAHLGDARG